MILRLFQFTVNNQLFNRILIGGIGLFFIERRHCPVYLEDTRREDNTAMNTAMYSWSTEGKCVSLVGKDTQNLARLKSNKMHILPSEKCSFLSE